MTALFAFEHVSVVRGATRVLDDVTAWIPASGITAIVGRSGAGKSTMLRCCNRLEQPTAGRLRFRDADLGSLDPLAHRRRAAMVFQVPTVLPGTALDNLRAADPELGVAGASALLARVGLPDALLDREADAMSGGEAQRLCLARALATRPEVVLADEPTASLDEASAAVLEQLARSLAVDGTPVVWVTHDRAQVRRIADRVIELADGRVRFAGTIAERAAREGGDA